MTRRECGWFVRFGLVVLSGLAAKAATAGESLERKVEVLTRSGPYRHAHWGLLVADARTGRTVYERNADQMFCPASVTKLFSTAAALVEFGPDFRFTTPVVRRGEVSGDGTLRGDLILVAQGDLVFGGRAGPDGSLRFANDDHTYAGWNPHSALAEGDPRAALDHLAKGVAAAGIKAVTGAVLVDDRRFATAASTGSGPTRLSPVVVNDNVIDVVVTPAPRAGELASVRLVPETLYAQADVRVETVERGKPARVELTPAGPRRFVVRGGVPVGHEPVVRIAEVDDPASFARTLFVEALGRHGVDCAASALGENPTDRLPGRGEVAKLPKVAEFTSPQFREYLKVILKVSHNLHASTLPLMLAAKHGEDTLDAGLRRVGAALTGLGVDPSAVSFGGGAGGARSDLVTPRATVALLRAMARRPDFPAFEAALPVLGRDGTLARSVGAESPALGRVRAKTGTFTLANGLDGKAVLASKALAGYLDTASGRPLVFAFFVNQVPLDARGEEAVYEATAAAGRLLGRLCEVFVTAELPEGPETSAVR